MRRLMCRESIEQFFASFAKCFTRDDAGPIHHHQGGGAAPPPASKHDQADCMVQVRFLHLAASLCEEEAERPPERRWGGEGTDGPKSLNSNPPAIAAHTLLPLQCTHPFPHLLCPPPSFSSVS